MSKEAKKEFVSTTATYNPEDYNNNNEEDKMPETGAKAKMILTKLMADWQ